MTPLLDMPGAVGPTFIRVKWLPRAIDSPDETTYIAYARMPTSGDTVKGEVELKGGQEDPFLQFVFSCGTGSCLQAKTKYALKLSSPKVTPEPSWPVNRAL